MSNWVIEFVNVICPEKIYTLNVIAMNEKDAINSVPPHIREYIQNQEIAKIVSISSK